MRTSIHQADAIDALGALPPGETAVPIFRAFAIRARTLSWHIAETAEELDAAADPAAALAEAESLTHALEDFCASGYLLARSPLLPGYSDSRAAETARALAAEFVAGIAAKEAPEISPAQACDARIHTLAGELDHFDGMLRSAALHARAGHVPPQPLRHDVSRAFEAVIAGFAALCECDDFPVFDADRIAELRPVLVEAAAALAANARAGRAETWIS
ncbi:hypothetical protein [Roseovarius sp. C03]|uniref:hypothetical protein n=1 Tax=Roseovarius sp. C03 TaxID=3449222 RepID=UPI003EDCA813